jgi:hypothetical protein
MPRYHDGEGPKEVDMDKRTIAVLTLGAVLVTLPAAALAADDSRVKSATRQVEEGAKKIGDGKVGQGVEDTAKGIGKTLVEGAKFTGEKLKESGKAAEPRAKSSWESFQDGANSLGSSVKSFFTNLFD